MLILKTIPKLSLLILIFLSLTQKIMAQSSVPNNINIPPNTSEIIEDTIPNNSDHLTPLPSDSLPQQSEPILTPSSPQINPSEINPSAIPLNIKIVEIWDSTVLQTELIEIIKNLKNEQDQLIFDSNITQELDQESQRPKLILKVNPNFAITFQYLSELRNQINQKYLENGYITSGSFISQNNDAFKQGIMQIYVLEGEISAINVTGLTHLNANYISSRLENGIIKPVNLQRLEEALQLLQLNPLIQQINANLIAGNRSGTNILQLEIREARAFHTGIITANRRSPSIGEWETNFFIQHNNLIGFGDSFSANYGLTEGFDTYDFNYTIPLNSDDGTMGINYSNSESIIIEKDFKDLDIRSESHNLSFNFNQPISKTPNSEFVLGLTLDLRQSQTYLLDNIPFSFSIGAENGESKVTVLRFSQQWLQRNNNNIFAARSQFNFGLDAFDATINNTGTDGRFFSWLGQFQYVQQLSPSTILLTSLNAQLTPNSLLSLEQFSVGGVDTVKGYRQNQLVADNGITGSISARINLTSDQNLQLTPFFAFGTVWNSDNSNTNLETIASLGLGFRWRIFDDFNLNVDYGIPLIPVKNQSNSLQEDGLHFSFGYQPW